MKKSCQRRIKRRSRIEKVTREKFDQFYIKLKSYDNSFNSRINKKVSIVKMSWYFLEPFQQSAGNVKVKLDLLTMQQKQIWKEESALYLEYCILYLKEKRFSKFENSGR